MQTDPVQLFIQAWKTMTGRLPSPQFEEAERFSVCFTDTPNPFMNLWVQNTPTLSSERFNEMLAAADARAAQHNQAVGGIICDEWCPENREEIAARHSLVPMVPMISMEAEDLLPARRPAAALDVRRVERDESARDLAMLNAHAYHLSEEMFDCIATMAFWPDDSCAFVGYVNEQPVSCAAALPIMDTVYIALVATSEAARGKGYAETVMRQAVVTGQEMMGVKRTTLHASLMGHPVYEAMGYSSSTRLTLIGREG